jgi:N-acylneuraminate cytidylyltransferase
VAEDSGARVVVIPARGGSKRVPRKNVRPLAGRPLVEYAIRTSLAAHDVERVVVSTDDAEVAEVALAAGAEVPFLRSADLSDDHTPLVPVVADSVERLGLSDETLVCCVYATAIGLLATDLDRGADLLAGSDLPYAVGVVRYPHPVQRALSMDGSGRVALVEPELALVRTQDLPVRWHDAGQFVWGRAHAWRAGRPVLTAALGVELPSWRVVDLDTEDDWARAEQVRARLAGSGLGYPAADVDPKDPA